MLKVTVYSSLDDDEPMEFTNIDYVSVVSGETYGKPALIAPGKPNDSRASIGETVLYINTRFVPMYEITRTSD